jgi:tyrosyl-tRNA synthetase
VDVEERLRRVVSHTQEVLVEEELRSLLQTTEHPKAYIGFEPSGLFHVGGLVTVAKVKDLEAAGFEVTVFLADWHAMINDKLGGSLDRIQAAGRLYESVFRSLGIGAGVRFRWASDVVTQPGYWARVLRCAKAMSLARAKRAITIMGRKEDEGEIDASKLFYPAMQVADIFELPADLAYAGMDQRRAHVLAREVAHHYGWKAPVALHTPLVSSLKGGGRMNYDDSGLIERKMSKSDPTSSIVIPTDDATIDARIKDAFCAAKEVAGNPVLELARYVVLPWEGKLAVERPAKFGGNVEFQTDEALLTAWKEGKLHPQDLKAAVAKGLQRILAPSNAFFRDHPEALPRPSAT